MFIPPSMPSFELDEPVCCTDCGQPIADDDFVYWDEPGEYYCEHCIDKLVKRVVKEARAFAKANCKITHPLPEYDEEAEFKCSREDYEAGERESYSPNAYMAHCRHNCTNYDDLIKSFDRDTYSDQLYYEAIKDRIAVLIEQERPGS